MGEKTSKQHHYLKCEKKYYQAAKRGEKTFELRKNDRDYKMTEYQAKTESLLFWGDLVKNGYKSKSESKYYWLVEESPYDCLLCDFHRLRCSECILKDCTRRGSLFTKWICAATKEEKMKYAKKIYNKIKNWKIQDNI